MADLSITNSFTADTLAQSAQVNTNYADISAYINARNQGTTEWDLLSVAGASVLASTLSVTASDAVPVTINGDQSLATIVLNNTAVDGDSVFKYQLSGTTVFSHGIDDGDADKFKFGRAEIGTETTFEIENSATAGITILNDPSGTPVANTLYKASVMKGWIKFDGSGTIAITDSFNVSSITDNATGDYSVNWDQDFANADYAVTASAGYILVAGNDNTANSVGSANIYSADLSGAGARADSSIISVIGIGDQ